MTPAPPPPPETLQTGWPPPPPDATQCPKCAAPATPAAQLQTCPKCGLAFALRAGKLTDAAVVVPPPDPQAKELKLRAPGLFVVSLALLKADAIGFGALDPVFGRFPMDEKGVRFEHLYSLVAWKALAVSEALLFFIVSLPVGLGGLAAVIGSGFHPAALIFGLPFVLLAAFHGWRTLGVKATRVRVYGPKGRLLDMQFAGSKKKRQAFHDELCRRCGLAPLPLP